MFLPKAGNILSLRCIWFLRENAHFARNQLSIHKQYAQRSCYSWVYNNRTRNSSGLHVTFSNNRHIWNTSQILEIHTSCGIQINKNIYRTISNHKQLSSKSSQTNDKKVSETCLDSSADKKLSGISPESSPDKNKQVSTSTTVTADDCKEKQRQSLYQKFRYMVNTFWHGCKALFYDVRQATRTRRKLGLYQQQDLSILTRAEYRHMQQTRKDVMKTFPVTLLFMIPFIGYAAPIIAYFYPKQLLSQQFWHPDQKKMFILEEYEKRSQYYLPLVKEVAVTCKEIHNKALFRLSFKIIDGSQPKNNELLPFKPVFSENNEFSLQKMPRYHLVKLCKCWLIPTSWYLPRWFLVSALRRRITRLHEDDMLILRDGIELLTPACVAQAVHDRGLDETSSICARAKFNWLLEWVKLSSEVTDEDISFLAHCAVFKATNFEAIEKLTENR